MIKERSIFCSMGTFRFSDCMMMKVKSIGCAQTIDIIGFLRESYITTPTSSGGIKGTDLIPPDFYVPQRKL